jgi:hypothetical protein
VKDISNFPAIRATSLIESLFQSQSAVPFYKLHLHNANYHIIAVKAVDMAQSLESSGIAPCALTPLGPEAQILASEPDSQLQQLDLTKDGSIRNELEISQQPLCLSDSDTSARPVTPMSLAMPIIQPDVGKSLRKFQEREEFLIEKYSEVFDMLEIKYWALERVLSSEVKDGFEESVIRAVITSIRDCMGMNELAMEHGRRVLWKGFEEKEDWHTDDFAHDRAVPAEMQVEGESEVDEEKGEIEVGAEGEGDWERI